MSFELRIRLLFVCFSLFCFAIIGRLFYWQIISAASLTKAADNQHWATLEIPAPRGEILASDGFPLVSNNHAYLIYASIPNLTFKPDLISKMLTPVLYADNEASGSASLMERLSREDLVWVPLKRRVTFEEKKEVEKMEIPGIGFQEESLRGYPEGSMAAHLLGFVGSDLEGKEKGYFGLEGFYNLELKGQAGWLRREKDPWGKPIMIGEVKQEKALPGRTLVTTIDRSVQFLIENKLKDGIDRYGAKSGNIIVENPQTGEIIAMASWPDYDPAQYWRFGQELFINPVAALTYEPGSIFKILIMSAAIDAGAVTPETACDICFGPITIGEYTINTWNQKYYPNSTMTEVIQHSDNVGMVFAAQHLGSDKLYAYLQKFGFGSSTGIDLEEEVVPPFRDKKNWGEIDLATVSFGQGIAVTPIQMIKATGALANQGKTMRPFIVKKVISDDKTVEIEPKVEVQVIKPVTAKVITEMMINAVDKGEAKWAKPNGYRIAGKTGTAQIAISGHYDAEKTIASFVGFAPADEPKFVMLVTLREPSSSQWGSETAAPLWFEISRELFNYYGIPPTQ